MSFRRSDDVHEFQLTDTELEIAHQIQNGDIRQILRREGAGLGKHTQAYLKLAARVRAERLLHQELLLLRAAKEQLTSLAAAEEIIAANHSQIRSLQRQLERERKEHVKELAAPAMAVHAAASR
jgi:hypothetical protein